MQKYILLFVFVTSVACHENKRQRVEDPFKMIDKHLTHTLAYHYMWPWSQLIKAAAAMEVEEDLEKPMISSDSEKFRMNLNVKRFKPDELRIKVKNRYITVEGRHKDKYQNNPFMDNHFIQSFVMPPGTRQEEVTAVLKENGFLCISVPKHALPPPPRERIVPIEVRLPVKIPEITEKPEIKPESDEKIESSTEKKDYPALPIQTSSGTPLEQLELVEATTHVGKIRKKELKTTTKTAKDNEVTKGLESNGLDYALVEQEE